MYLNASDLVAMPYLNTSDMPDVYYQSTDVKTSSPPIVSAPQPMNAVALGILALLAALAFSN